MGKNYLTLVIEYGCDNVSYSLFRRFNENYNSPLYKPAHSYTFAAQSIHYYVSTSGLQPTAYGILNRADN